MKGVLVLFAAAAAFAPAAARAERFSTTDVQLLWGADFDDPFFDGRKPRDGHLTTVTLEHYGTWGYGDNFFFFDLLHGSFVDAAGAPLGRTVAIYGEWTSRLSAGKLLGRKSFLGILKDVYLAGELDRGGDGFWNDMIGVGVDVKLPGKLVLGVNAFYRDDKFNAPTFQVTPYWNLPFAVGPVGLVFTGFVDFAGTDTLGLDVNSQPQLLIDLGRPWGQAGTLYTGIEWYVHRNARHTTSAPQIMLKWVF